MDIRALDKMRIERAQRLNQLKAVHQSTLAGLSHEGRADFLREVRLAKNAWLAAEEAYQRAISTLSSQELMELTRGAA